MSQDDGNGSVRGIEIPGFESWESTKGNYAHAFSMEIARRFAMVEDLSGFRKRSEGNTIHLASEDGTMGLVIAGRLILTPDYEAKFETEKNFYKSLGARIKPEETFVDRESQKAGFLWYSPDVFEEAAAE